MRRWANIVNDECVTVVEQDTQPTPGEWIDVSLFSWFGPGCRRINGEWSPP